MSYDIAQMALFDQKIIPPGKFSTIQERFEMFHRYNGHVYAAFVLITREYLKETGQSHVGAKMIWEVCRWRFALRTKSGEPFVLNNDFCSRYSRLIMDREPDLKNVFRVRELRAA